MSGAEDRPKVSAMLDAIYDKLGCCGSCNASPCICNDLLKAAEAAGKMEARGHE